MKKLIALFLVTVVFSACGSGSQADRAGKALAEMRCAMLSSETTEVTNENFIDEIVMNSGFADYTELEEYLNSIEGTEEQNEVAVAVRTHLQNTCADELEAIGINAADLAESLMVE